MRVTTFSRHFPATHPRKGEPTQFVEKILLSLIEIGHISMSKAVEIGRELNLEGFQSMNELRQLDMTPKHHTIRAGHRWRAGDKFSPRIWSGRPYASKQIEFAPGIEIVKTWRFEVEENGVPSIDGYYLFNADDTTADLEALNKVDALEKKIAENDGLTWQDWNDWLIMPCFKKGKPFDGQIICWNPEVNY